MVPTIRSAPATNAPTELANQRSDSDLDDYELQDNLTSSRPTEFHPPLSDHDVSVAEKLDSALQAASATAISLQEQEDAPPGTELPITNRIAEALPNGSSSVGTPAPSITCSLADADSLQGMPTLSTFPDNAHQVELDEFNSHQRNLRQ